MEYDDPCYYFAMTETIKNAADATTPLRICMNSSLKMCVIF